MLILKLILNWFRGEVSFHVYNGFPDMFLDQCLKKGVSLKNAVFGENELFASVADADQKLVQTIAKRSGMTYECIRKHGFPATLRRCRYRLGIPVGCLLVFLLFTVLSGFIWSIEIDGVTDPEAGEILSLLDSMDIRKGSFTSSVSCHEIREKIEGMSEQISKVTVDLNGSRLYVFIRKREQPIRIENKHIGTGDVTASKDGEILTVHPLVGTAAVRPGDKVKKGDILISGTKKNKDGSVSLVYAKGSVRAKIKRTISAQCALRLTVQGEKKSKDSYSVSFFGVCFPPAPEDYSATAYYLKNRQTVFPVGIKRSHRIEWTKKQLRLCEEQAKLTAVNDLLCTAFDKIGETEVLNSDFRFVSGTSSVVEGTFICSEEIGQNAN